MTVSVRQDATSSKGNHMNICVLYGGKSGEHEVSLRSAASVIKHLDRAKYQVVAVGINKDGRWHLQEHIDIIDVQGEGDTLSIVPTVDPVSIVPADGIHGPCGKLSIDCVFPVLHGNFGEDGVVQGLLETAGVPYVGAGVLGSAVSMDKETAKRLWRDAGLPIVDFAVVRREKLEQDVAEAMERLNWPLFVKPGASGSSLGASRATNLADLNAALSEALRYDNRALLERYIDAREIECAVLEFLSLEKSSSKHAQTTQQVEFRRDCSQDASFAGA